MRKFFFVLLMVAATAISCSTQPGAFNESIFYGVWIKGTNAGDTLTFFNRNGKNLVRYNLSFNAALPAMTETEYAYRDNKLAFKSYLSMGNDFLESDGFRWIRPGDQFECKVNQLWPILAATGVAATFTKQ